MSIFLKKILLKYSNVKNLAVKMLAITTILDCDLNLITWPLGDQPCAATNILSNSPYLVILKQNVITILNLAPFYTDPCKFSTRLDELTRERPFYLKMMKSFKCSQIP